MLNYGNPSVTTVDMPVSCGPDQSSPEQSNSATDAAIPTLTEIGERAAELFKSVDLLRAAELEADSRERRAAELDRHAREAAVLRRIADRLSVPAEPPSNANEPDFDDDAVTQVRAAVGRAGAMSPEERAARLDAADVALRAHAAAPELEPSGDPLIESIRAAGPTPVLVPSVRLRRGASDEIAGAYTFLAGIVDECIQAENDCDTNEVMQAIVDSVDWKVVDHEQIHAILGALCADSLYGSPDNDTEDRDRRAAMIQAVAALPNIGDARREAAEFCAANAQPNDPMMGLVVTTRDAATPSVRLSGPAMDRYHDIHRALDCIDQWAASGDGVHNMMRTLLEHVDFNVVATESLKSALVTLLAGAPDSETRMVGRAARAELELLHQDELERTFERVRKAGPAIKVQVTELIAGMVPR